MTALVADDSALVRRRVRRILEAAGFAVEEAEDGVAAERRLRQGDIDVALLDITMPEMDGLQVLKECAHRVPCVVVSALGHERVVLEAVRLGARDFVVKPFAPERLLSAVRRALAR